MPLAFLVALSAGLASAYHRAAKSGAALRSLLAMQLIVDVAVISYLLLFTGGASSPFVPLYLLAPLLGGVFLAVRGGMLLAVAAAAAYAVLFATERGGMLPPVAYGLTERLSDSALAAPDSLSALLFTWGDRRRPGATLRRARGVDAAGRSVPSLSTRRRFSRESLERPGHLARRGSFD